MNSIDLTPLNPTSVGFDRLVSLLDTALRDETARSGYVPYNIEALEDNRYAITLAVAGFSASEIDVTVENGVLTVRGGKDNRPGRKFLHQGIANNSFERKFNLAEYVEVTGAEIKNGLLTVHLLKEVPEGMKPRSIPIRTDAALIEHKATADQARQHEAA